MGIKNPLLKLYTSKESKKKSNTGSANSELKKLMKENRMLKECLKIALQKLEKEGHGSTILQIKNKAREYEN